MNRLVNKGKKVLVISPVPCPPPYAGNAARVLEVCQTMKLLGHKVYFAGLNFDDDKIATTSECVDQFVHNFSWPKQDGFSAKRTIDFVARKYREAFEGFGRPLDKRVHPIWLQQARKLQTHRSFDVVIINYVVYSRLLDAFDGALKIIDTHDVFSNRNEILAKHLPGYKWYSVTPEYEKIGLMRADAVLAIQEREADFFREELQLETVRCVGTLSDPKTIGPVYSRTAGFLGAVNPINLDGLNWFLSRIWPIVAQKDPEAEFLIGGSICSKLSELPQRVSMIGTVQQLESFYGKCAVTVCPLRAGTGLKIKAVESLRFGRNVVSTPIGAEGLKDFLGRGLRIAHSCEDFATALLQELQDAATAGNGDERDAVYASLVDRNRAALADLLGNGVDLA